VREEEEGRDEEGEEEATNLTDITCGEWPGIPGEGYLRVYQGTNAYD